MNVLRMFASSPRPDPDLATLAREAGAAPVLMDVGAAGTSPAVWRPVAGLSTLIAFDPDARNPDPSFGRNFARAIMVGAAVIPDDAGDVANFILTEYPSCSSMLEPDLEALGSFVFRDYFKPVKRVSAPATSLNRVVSEHGLAGINWLKIDSQGLDLRILKSLSPDNLGRLLAVDIEPGLIDAYKDEDLFPECHSWLKANGFWMAEYHCQAYAKIRPETVARLERAGFDRKALMAKLAKSPTCVEGRYLREVSWMERHGFARELWVVAALFGFCADKLGYVFDIVAAYEALFGRDAFIEGAERLAASSLGK